MELALKTLQKHPERSIFWVAKKLKMTTLEVSFSQHEYLKQLRKVC